MKMKRLALTMLCMFTLGGAASAQSQETGAISTTPKGTRFSSSLPARPRWK